MIKNISNGNTNKEDVELARLKFAVIAPAIMKTYTEPTKTAYYKKVAEKSLTLPDGKEVKYNYNTFEKWEGLYKKYGLDGLLPKMRNDAGTSRVLSEQAVAEIYRLKEKFPRINATLIYTKLVEDGIIKHSEVSLCTIQRFVKKNDLKSARNINIKDRKAFEEEYPCNMYQADTCHTIYITENGVKRKVYLISVIDDHSRVIVGARFFYEDNAYNFQKVLKEWDLAFTRILLSFLSYINSNIEFNAFSHNLFYEKAVFPLSPNIITTRY